MLYPRFGFSGLYHHAFRACAPRTGDGKKRCSSVSGPRAKPWKGDNGVIVFLREMLLSASFDLPWT